MKILIATTNPAKVMVAKTVLSRLGHEGVTFADLDLKLIEPDETKSTAEEIAREKAVKYAEQYKDLPILTRDDTTELVGVNNEDNPKNHNKEFIVEKVGEYSDENGEKVFMDIAKKYDGEVPLIFSFGFALAWWEKGQIKIESGLSKAQLKLVDKPSPKKTPGFCFAPVSKVKVDGQWKYDSELTDEERFRTYQFNQGQVIGDIIKRMENKSEV